MNACVGAAAAAAAAAAWLPGLLCRLCGRASCNPALPAPNLLQGSEDGGLAENARALAGLLQQRPQGSTRFVELQVGGAGQRALPAATNRAQRRAQRSGCGPVRRGLHESCQPASRKRYTLSQGAATNCLPLPALPQGVGHIPMDECPQRLNELLAEFMQQEVAAGSGGVPR